MSTPAQHTNFQFAEVNKLSKQLGQMRSWGVSALDPGYLRLNSALSEAIGKVGFRLPRTTTLIRLLAGLSPGEVRLWADAEIGWIAESRVEPGAPPVYKQVTDQEAEKIATGKLTHELEERLMAPETYYGE